MRRLIVGFFAFVGFVTILSLVGVALLIKGVRPTVTPLPGNIILSIDLTEGLADGPGEDRWVRLLVGGKPTLRDFLDALERAGDDQRVKGLYARLGDDTIGLATAQEVRDAVAAFRAKGKFAIAFADSFGEFAPGTRPYYLAAGFDEIWLQPMGMLGLTGLYAEVPFFRGTLDLLGIIPSFDHRKEYKTAMNSLTETKMTAPHREEVEGLVGSMAGQIIHGLIADRRLSEAEVRAAIDRGPLTGQEALQAKLVDRLGYRDEALARARERAGAGAELMPLKTYLNRVGRPHRDGVEIALIYGSGLIQRGAGSDDPFSGSGVMAAEKIARAFRSAAGDHDVRAILFRIDSPGGSVVASETIWREVARARDRGKPVIVSMGEVAGSGGYYIAAPADKIVAEPATLTGSIGVLAGKVVLGGLLQKLGITTDSVQVGNNAGMFDVTQDFSDAAHQRLETFLDQIYADFKERVATGRHLPADQVEAVAKGRVWSGEDAKQKGLVDALGGYREALRLAREAANIPEAAPVKLTVFPPQKDPAELLYDRFFNRDRDGEDAAASSGALLPALGRAGPLLRQIGALFDDPLVLTMPPLGQAR
jgi:protease-4